MTDVIFNDFYMYIQKRLLSAQKDVKIVVAWINFSLYYSIFMRLLDKNVCLQIIINDDVINAKNDMAITLLKKKGAIIFKRKMPTTRQYMHEKFCIIDSALVLCGSYNWSLNANKNFENILIVDEKIVVDKFLNEFNVIMSMNTLYIQQLHVSNSYNILILEEEDNATVGIICNVKENELIEVKRKYYDICILYNLNGIYDKYDDFTVQLYDAPFELERINAEIEFEMQQYLCELKNLLEISIPIHGIGRIARDMYYGDFEDVYVKIIWKERFCVLLDRYEWN